MDMGPTPVSVAPAGHHYHCRNAPNGPGVQIIFEFSLYLIRKWFPDVHGAHPGVDGVGG